MINYLACDVVKKHTKTYHFLVFCDKFTMQVKSDLIQFFFKLKNIKLLNTKIKNT